MSLLGIAWRNIKQRAFTSGLTALSMSLGVALVVATLITGGVVKQAFESGAGLGYNMIIGAKGSPLQLVLNSVYFISKPIENISLATYAEFLPARERPDRKDGTWAASTQTAVPICMGDYFRGHRVIGTNSTYFDQLTRGNGQAFEFSSGTNFHDKDLYTAVLGSQVALTLNLRVGDTIAPTHGADDGKVHDPFQITGILSRTDTPIDRGVFVNMEGFYLQEGHAKPIESTDVSEQTKLENDESPGEGLLPFNQREVTAILLETAALPGLPAELTAMGLRNAINEGREAQAALPIAEIRVLLDLFVTPLELRSRDVAIMRALGARRSVVLATVLIEAILLAVGGGVIGLLLGHGTVGLIGPWIATNAGVSAGFLSYTTAELLLVPFLVILAILAALLPAVAAYRTDVARWLG